MSIPGSAAALGRIVSFVMRPRAAALLVAFVLLIVIGAVAARAADTIKVGEYASLTGKEASMGQASHNGTLLAVEEINAAGGVLGQKLQLLTEDTQSKQGESGTVVRKLISRDKVV